MSEPNTETDANDDTDERPTYEFTENRAEHDPDTGKLRSRTLIMKRRDGRHSRYVRFAWVEDLSAYRLTEYRKPKGGAAAEIFWSGITFDQTEVDRLESAAKKLLLTHNYETEALGVALFVGTGANASDAPELDITPSDAGSRLEEFL